MVLLLGRRYASMTEHLFLAALVMGFSIGFMEAPTLSYVGEIAQPHLRGALASFTSVYISVGMLLMYIMATFTDWRTAAAISTSVPIITFVAISQVGQFPPLSPSATSQQDTIQKGAECKEANPFLIHFQTLNVLLSSGHWSWGSPAR